MARSLLVAPVADHSALARTCLGLLRALDRRGVKVAFVKPVAQLPGVEELNIGHSIVSRAVLVGIERAVREMKDAMALHYPNPKK